LNNDGSGRFTSGLRYSFGGSAASLADLNDDANLDLVLTDAWGGGVSLYLGRDDGLFSGSATFVGGAVPSSAPPSIADLNGDGGLDIVVAGEPDLFRRFIPEVSVILTDGGWTFPDQSFPDIGFADYRPAAFVLEDLDGDGALDLVTANGYFDTVSVLHGYPDGTFGHPSDSAVADGSPYALALGDVNGDGIPDAIAANLFENTVAVLLGNAEGTFDEEVAYYPTGNRNVGDGKGFPSSVAVGDVNADMALDIVTADRDDGTLSILLGTGDGTFAGPVPYAVGSEPSAVSLGDLNDDGALDIVAANWGAGNISILLGNGDGTFAGQQTYDVNDSPTSVILGDLNKDGLLDMVVACSDGYWSSTDTDAVTVYLGNGDGSFAGPVEYVVGHDPYSVALADINRDGTLDIVTVNNWDNEDSVSVLLGYGDGTFTESGDYAVGKQPRFVAVGDLNGDGGLDIVTANEDASTTVLLKRRGVLVPDDNYEDNNDKETVDAQPPAVASSANFGPVDTAVWIPDLRMVDGEDWYRFETVCSSEVEHVVRTLFYHNQGDLDVELLAADGTTVLGASDSATDNEEISLAGLPAGTYYARVYGYLDAINPTYTLQILPGSNDDVYEDNDSIAIVNSRPLGAPDSPNLGPLSGVTTINDLVFGTDGSDYYRFTTGTPEPGTSRVAISFTHDEGNLQLVLMDGAGKVLGASTSATDNEEVRLDGLPAGTYYAYVYGENSASNPDYSLTIDMPVWQDDAYEENDRRIYVSRTPEGVADSPNLGLIPEVISIADLVLGPDGEDWFRFETPDVGGANDYVRIEFVDANGDIDLQLVDEEGQVIEISTSHTDNEYVSLLGLPAGVYYAHVFTPLGDPNPSYRLIIQTDAPAARPLSAPFTTDENYTLEYEVDGVPGSAGFILDKGLNELIVTAPSGSPEPFELLFNVTRVGSMTDQASYQYDLTDNLSRVTDALGDDTIYEYDGLSRLISVEHPHSSVFARYAYDASDNLVRMEDGDDLPPFYVPAVMRVRASMYLPPFLIHPV